MAHQNILYTKEEGIATITLNRPESMNAVTPGLIADLAGALEEAGKEEEVRVVVVTGAGRGFCSGMDLKAFSAGAGVMPLAEVPLAEKRNLLRETYHRIPRALADLDKPVIAAVNGPAVAGGMDLASMCDIRIASERAKFGMTYVRMGLTPSVGCYYLPRIVGLARAAELIWTGRVIDAQEALAIGYVSRVVPHEELGPATKDLASRLARGPAVAMQLSKRLLYRCLDLDLRASLEAHEAALLIAQSTEDAKEGPRAWVEKREPIFKGR